MKTILELQKQILRITLTIHQEYPELSKYLNEMPESNAEFDDVTIKSLENYYQSLEAIIHNYAETHRAQKKIT